MYNTITSSMYTYNKQYTEEIFTDLEYIKVTTLHSTIK